MVSLKTAPIVNTDGDDSDDGGNPPEGYGQESEPQIQAPAELVPTKTAVDKGILSASVGSGNSVVLSSEDLGNFIASGGTQFCLKTHGSEFIISAEMLNGLNADGQQLRIVFTGNALEIYVGTSTTTAKAIPVTSGETAAAGVAATAVSNLQTNGNSGLQSFAAVGGGTSRAETG
ncbi:hypothetical protein ACTQ56_09985 [[Clostridium] aminophilum]|uniref:hypothetical protein n=1 Tax=[Clostridium] aminophilum TaxID=1526 RepID=UPI003F996376